MLSVAATVQALEGRHAPPVQMVYVMRRTVPSVHPVTAPGSHHLQQTIHVIQ